MAQTCWMCYGNNVHKSPLTTATGIPQGDPASPFALAVLMAAAGLRVQDQIKAPPQDFRQLVYLDDRTLLASSPSLLQRSIDLWAQESSLFKLKEHPGKMQKAHRDHVAFPHGIEGLHRRGCPGRPEARSREVRFCHEVSEPYRAPSARHLGATRGLHGLRIAQGALRLRFALGSEG